MADGWRAMPGGYRIRLAVVLMAVVGLWPIILVMLSPRDLSVGEQFDAALEGGPLMYMASQVGVGLVLALCALIIRAAIIRRSIPRRNIELWLLYVAYFIATAVTGSIFGVESGFNSAWLYFPLVVTTLCLAVDVDQAGIRRITKIVLRCYVYVSLIGALVAPQWALLSGYDASIAGIDFRLFGAAPHANTLGAMGCACLILELADRESSRWRYLHVVSALLVIALAQSKASWIFLALACVYHALGLLGRSLVYGRGKHIQNQIRFISNSIFVILCAVAFAGLMGIPGYDLMGRASELDTLTGRTYIWEITIDVWKENPIFGYGTALWGEDFRMKYGMPFAGHAHNQFIHVLGSSGMFGAVGLIAYLGLLGSWAMQVNRHDRAPAYLFGLIAIYSATEVPLRNPHVFSAFSFLHIILLAQLLYARQLYRGISGGEADISSGVRWSNPSVSASPTR